MRLSLFIYFLSDQMYVEQLQGLSQILKTFTSSNRLAKDCEFEHLIAFRIPVHMISWRIFGKSPAFCWLKSTGEKRRIYHQMKNKRKSVIF